MRKGTTHTDDTKAKIGATRVGKQWSAEVKAKISESMRKRLAEKKAAKEAAAQPV